MKQNTSAFAMAVVAALLTGCGGGSNGGAIPSTSQGNLTVSKLQFAVGTALNAADGTTGLNVVATFRQPNGLSAVTADTPSITGPAGFLVPAGFLGAYGSVNNDDGTNTISSSPQVAVNQTPTSTTLGDFTGVFSYGLAPLNSDNVSQEVYVPGSPNSYPQWGFEASNYGNTVFFAEPFGAAAAAQSIFLVGPPAVPFFNDGTFPAGFAGYSPGFTAFEIPPVAGSYTMNVKVSTANGPSPSYTATGSMTATVSPVAAPVITSAVPANGGLSGTVTIGAGAVETLVFVTDYRFNGQGNVASINYYTAEVTGTGAQTWTIPGTLGPCTSPGCENNAATQTASFTLGDASANPPIPPDDYTVQAISFDYQALEAGPPSNTSQTPTITGANGQADLAIGLSYPVGAPGVFGKHRMAVYGKNP